MSSGVTENAGTSPSHVGSNLTFNRLDSPGTALVAVTAASLTIHFHSSTVVGREAKIGLRGAAMIACISGLTVVGTGTLRAGISNPSETAAVALFGESLPGVMLKKTSLRRRALATSGENEDRHLDSLILISPILTRGASAGQPLAPATSKARTMPLHSGLPAAPNVAKARKMTIAPSQSPEEAEFYAPDGPYALARLGLSLLIATLVGAGMWAVTRRQERKTQQFKSPGSVQKFLSTHAAVYNTFNVLRHLISAHTHRARRAVAMTTWRSAVAAASKFLRRRHFAHRDNAPDRERRFQSTGRWRGPSPEDYPFTAPAVIDRPIWRYMPRPRRRGGRVARIITAAATPQRTPPPEAAKKNEAPTLTGVARLVVSISPNRNSFHE